MRIKIGLLTLVSTAALVAAGITATAALAHANNITAFAAVKTSTTSVVCRGRNTVSSAVKTLGVSVVCQRQDSNGNWVDVQQAPAKTCSNCTAVELTYTATCSRLGRGHWHLRTQADGWHVHFNGSRRDDPARVNTTIRTLDCP
jgi:hypothetical protein